MTQYPAAQQPDAVPGELSPKPQQLKTAVNLMYVGALLAVIGGVVTLIGVPDMVASLTAQEIAPGRTQAELQVTESALRIFATVIGIFTIVVGGGLWVWMALANGAGKSWARVVATVLAVIGLILSVMNLFAPLLNMILAAITIVVTVVVLVMLWNPSVSNYFAARKGYANQARA